MLRAICLLLDAANPPKVVTGEEEVADVAGS